MLEGRGYQGEGAKGEKWDNYNSIINKIYLKKVKWNVFLKTFM